MKYVDQKNPPEEGAQLLYDERGYGSWRSNYKRVTFVRVTPSGRWTICDRDGNKKSVSPTSLHVEEPHDIWQGWDGDSRIKTVVARRVHAAVVAQQEEILASALAAIGADVEPRYREEIERKMRQALSDKIDS